MDEGKYHRRSIRLPGYDYSTPGGYFVTINSCNKKEVLGRIRSGQVILSALGEIVREEWLKTGDLRNSIEVYEDEFIVMPNHLHGIIWITDLDDTSQNSSDEFHQAKINMENLTAGDPVLKRTRKTLGSILAGIKAKVTSRAKTELQIDEVWQRNYYEHIIRNEKELRVIREYIRNNPIRWEQKY